MTAEGLNYFSGNVPGGIWLLLGLIAVTWFVIWFVYHFSQILRRSRFWQIGLSFTLFWLLAYTFFWQRFPPPLDRQRVLILTETQPTHTDSFYDLYVKGIQIYEFLRVKTSPNAYLIYHPDWLLQAAEWDSLVSASYQDKVLRFMRADFVLRLKHGQDESGVIADLTPVGADPAAAIGRAIREFDDGLQMAPDFLRSLNIDPEVTQIYGPPWAPDAQRSWARSRLFLLAGDSRSAQQGLKSVVQRHADFYPALFDLIQIQIDSALTTYGNSGQSKVHLSQAAQYLEILRDRDLRDPRALRLRGEYALLSQSFVQAEGRLKESFFLDRDDDRLYLDLARLHPSRYRVLKFLKEESLLERALFINPASILGRIQYSDYLNLIQQPEASEQIIKEMLVTFPHQFSLRLALGRLYIAHDKYTEAVAILGDMLNISGPNLASVKFNLAIAYFHDARIGDAKKMLEELENDNPDAYLYLAYIHEKQGDIKTAVQYLRKRIRNNQGPDDPFKEEARKHLVKLLNQHGDPEE